MTDHPTFCGSKISFGAALPADRRQWLIVRLAALYRYFDGDHDLATFKWAIDRDYARAFFPDINNPRFTAYSPMKVDIRAIMPRSIEAQDLISRHKVAELNKLLRMEHIVSLKSLFAIFQRGEFDELIDSFALALISTEQERAIGHAGDRQRYIDHALKIIVPVPEMIVSE